MKNRMLVAEKINTVMLTLARESRGVSQTELAEKLGCSQSSVLRLETGEIEIKPEIFSKLTKILNYPEAFFYQSGEIIPSSFYRRRDKVPMKLFNKLDANINIIRIGVDHFLSTLHFPVAELPQFPYDGETAPVETAKALRKKWNVPKGPIENITQLLEKHGIIILTADFETERIDGRSLITPSGYPLIILNRTLFGDRQRFTLAYELGHLMMHAFARPKIGVDASHEANVFAAEFLMEEKSILSDFKEAINIPKLMELKLKWKVSMQSLLYRACDLEKVNDAQKRYLLKRFNELKIRRREPPELDIVKETPTLLRDLITKYRSKQKMSVKEIAHLFCLNEPEFLQRYQSTNK